MASATAFSRQVDVFLANLNGDARREAMASAAKQALADAAAQNERILQRPVAHKTIVDGREGAAETEVKPGGTIVYLFAVGSETLAKAVDEAFTILIQQAPYANKRAGADPATHYRDVFRLFVNGTQRDFARGGQAIEFADTDEIQLTNLQPYARKVERGWSDQAPNGVFESTAAILRQRFGRIVNVRFAYDRYPGFEVGRSLRGGRVKSRADINRAARYPTIYLTLK